MLEAGMVRAKNRRKFDKERGTVRHRCLMYLFIGYDLCIRVHLAGFQTRLDFG